VSYRLKSVAALGLVAVAFSACGDSGASEEELERARQQGVAKARQQEKIERIERQLKDLKKGGPDGGSNSPSTTAAPTAASGGGTDCGENLSVGPNTTCAFAANVRSDYYNEIGGGEGTVYSYSPVTGRVYAMYCSAGAPHVCTGGNDASVYFP